MNVNVLNEKAITDRLFNADNYESGETELSKTAFGRLLSKCHIIFVWRFISLLLKARKIAVAGRYDTGKWVASSFYIMRVLEKSGARFRISGMNNIDSIKEPVVFVSNHMSILETMVFPCLVGSKREVTFVVKDSLVTHPLFGPIMSARNPIIVSRNNSRDDLTKVMNEGLAALAAGTSVIIFPQSTRRPDFNPDDMNSLGVKLAKKAGVKVVPIAIKTDFWENGKIIKDLGPLRRNKPVHIKFGEVMAINGAGKEEHNKIVAFIQQNYTQWCNEIQKNNV